MFALRSVLLPIPFTLVWMMMIGRFHWDSLLIGYVLSFFIVSLVVSTQELHRPAQIKDTFGRAWAFISYVADLLKEIFLSGIDVFLRVIGVRSITRSGIIAVPIQDDEYDEVTAGLSAHGITITPGELVVAYDRDNKVMYVHCLDVALSAPTLNEKQANRVKKFRRILGHD